MKENKKDKTLKKENSKKEKMDKALKKEKIKKEKKPNKFIESMKKNRIVDRTETVLFVIIILCVFLLINIGMQKLNLTPIDFSQEKLYTLTDESKEKVKDVDQEVKIYFVGYSEDDSTLELAKQYNKANEKISAEAVDANNRPDLVNKYGIESGVQGIIVESGEKYKVLTSSDLVTYDTSTYETISIAEKKLTSSIISVVSQKVPKIYFLEGYSDYTLGSNMQYLKAFLGNEVNEVETVNVITTGKIPDDCDTLVITTPSKDFDDVAVKAIKEYINSGRNILWFNSAVTQEQNFPNVNEILALYGVKPFEKGIIIETDTSKMESNYPNLIKPDIQSSTLTKDLVNTTGVLLANATKINIDTDNLESLNVEQKDLLTSESAFFRTDLTKSSMSPSSDEKTGSFIIGSELDKTIKEKNDETGEEKVESKLVIYGENNFVSDTALSRNSQLALIQLEYNKDLALNSIAYLSDREEDISVRKNTGTVTYTATEQQDTIVKTIIFTVPLIIIIIGIIVWQVRRRKK